MSDNASSNCNNMFIYSLVDYDNGGILVNIFTKGGLQSLCETFESNEFMNYMYQNGSGKELDQYSLTNLESGTHSNANNKSLRRICWKLHLRGIYGESLLHILIICNTKMHTLIATKLLSLYPNLANDIFEDQTYYGVSPLHLAIIYRNESLVELLLECKAEVHQRAVGQFFVPKKDSNKDEIPSFGYSRYFGEYPLSWAASIDDKRTYNTLINYGADPNQVDTYGNMVLHVIVAREKLMIFGFASQHPVRPALPDMANNYGLTPLALACVLGKAQIFHEIIELSCQEFWTYNIVTCCGYPLNVVDSMQMESADTNGRSALAIILEGKNSEHVDMLKGGIIQKLLEEKWKTFGHRQFMRRIFHTLFHLLILSTAVYLRPHKNMQSICESDITKIVRTSVEIIACLSCVRHIIGQIKEFPNKSFAHFLKSLTASIPRTFFFISNILLFLCCIMRLLGNVYLEEILLIVALPCSWYFLVFFAAAVKLTGPFVSMIRYMIVEDMRQFSIIYLVFLYGFSQTFYFLLKRPTNKLKPSNYSSYQNSWMELFRMTLGVHEYEELRNSFYHWIALFFFVLFMILMPILLLNMLIAMMGNTYALVISQSEREWTMQWAKILLELEKSLSTKESRMFLNQYSISITPKEDNEKQISALMVIKKKKISKAKLRKQAIANWKRLRWSIKMLATKDEDQKTSRA